MAKEHEDVCLERPEQTQMRERGTPGKATQVSLGTFQLPAPAVVGLGPKPPATPKQLAPLNGPLFELENRVKSDYERLKHSRYDITSADDYVARVDRTFGSLREYLDWASRSDTLLERRVTPKKRVRDLVELSGAEQKVFFRWVSWHYHARLNLSDDNIVALITRGLDPRMAAALGSAETALGHRIRAQGANPRPMKNPAGRYRLGTMSEHATGMAVDIDPARNPILGANVWRAILRVTGLTPDLGLAKWTSNPRGYYDSIANVDATWARAVDNAIAARRWSRNHPHALESRALAKPEPMPGAVPKLLLGKPALLHEDSTAAIQELLGAGAGDAVKMLAALPGFHFLGHSRELVLALRDQGMRWGATFFPDNVDLHHFEIPQPPLPPPPAAAPIK